MDQPMAASATGVVRARRSLGAAAILAPWLLLITFRQVPLYDGSGGGPPSGDLLPLLIVVAAIAVALVVRRARPSVGAHVLCLAVVVSGVALLAANLGTPFANATGDYCGDLCRTAIMFRAGTFLVWPAITAAGLRLAARADSHASDPVAIHRAEWSKAWIAPTLILGYLASAAWWQRLFA